MTAKLYYFPDQEEFRNKLAGLSTKKRKESLDLFNYRRRIFKLWVGSFSEQREEKTKRLHQQITADKGIPTS